MVEGHVPQGVRVQVPLSAQNQKETGWKTVKVFHPVSKLLTNVTNFFI
jgi:hypothetical protein